MPASFGMQKFANRTIYLAFLLFCLICFDVFVHTSCIKLCQCICVHSCLYNSARLLDAHELQFQSCLNHWSWVDRCVASWVVLDGHGARCRPIAVRAISASSSANGGPMFETWYRSCSGIPWAFLLGPTPLLQAQEYPQPQQEDIQQGQQELNWTYLLVCGPLSQPCFVLSLQSIQVINF